MRIHTDPTAQIYQTQRSLRINTALKTSSSAPTPTQRASAGRRKFTKRTYIGCSRVLKIPRGHRKGLKPGIDKLNRILLNVQHIEIQNDRRAILQPLQDMADLRSPGITGLNNDLIRHNLAGIFKDRRQIRSQQPIRRIKFYRRLS